MNPTNLETMVIWINITDCYNQMRLIINMETSATSGITFGYPEKTHSQKAKIMIVIHSKVSLPYLTKEQILKVMELCLHNLNGFIAVYCIAVITMLPAHLVQF